MGWIHETDYSVVNVAGKAHGVGEIGSDLIGKSRHPGNIEGRRQGFPRPGIGHVDPEVALYLLEIVTLHIKPTQVRELIRQQGRNLHAVPLLIKAPAVVTTLYRFPVVPPTA
jgi:hypothetical protein